MDTEIQRRFWNEWNRGREQTLGDVSRDQRAQLDEWLRGRSGLRILDVGCGAGWTVEAMLGYGSVVGTDLADGVLERARQRIPRAKFIAGDFMGLDLGTYDVVVCLEVLAHVTDQPAFVDKLASHLVSQGDLILATQNAPVLRRNSRIPPPGVGQIRKWVDRRELRALLAPHFEIREMTTLTPLGHDGLLRLTNSPKLESLLPRGWKGVRERLGLGWTIMTRARRRS